MQEADDSNIDLEKMILDANDGDEITIEPGTYKIHNISITKNLTLQGNGNPDDIIIDGENKSSILLIRNDAVHLTLKNLTFINGCTDNFGGAVSIETGHVYVDYCNFINNTALENTNAGAISNYGTSEQKGYLLVNNSLFVNNHADHDGGAITTCFANSYIYNSVFIGNTAHRDGGAIRVSVGGYGVVEDCIFMYNHADEWGGAYYSWASNSIINRCIFMNNTGGTNGGAVMVSGNLTMTNSIIVNNTSEKTGGSFYIQQPMFEAMTEINVHDNLITNNTSPLGKEIYIKWRQTKYFYPDFNNNDWGDEDPTNSDVIDPDHVTSRSKVTSTKPSSLLDELNLDLLNRHVQNIKDYFPKNYFGDEEDTQEEDTQKPQESNTNNLNQNRNPLPIDINDKTNNTSNQNINMNSTNSNHNSDEQTVNGTNEAGSDSNDPHTASEIFEHTSEKSIAPTAIGVILFVIVGIIALAYGYKRNSKKE